MEKIKNWITNALFGRYGTKSENVKEWNEWKIWEKTYE